MVLDDWTTINEPKNEAMVCDVSEEKPKEVERQKRSGVRKLTPKNRLTKYVKQRGITRCFAKRYRENKKPKRASKYTCY